MIKGFHSKKTCFHSRFSALSYWSYLPFIEAIRVLAQQMSLSTEFHGTLCSISQRWYVHHRSSEQEQNQRWRDHSDWLFFTNRRIITIVLCYSRRLMLHVWFDVAEEQCCKYMNLYIFTIQLHWGPLLPLILSKRCSAEETCVLCAGPTPASIQCEGMCLLLPLGSSMGPVTNLWIVHTFSLLRSHITTGS